MKKLAFSIFLFVCLSKQNKQKTKTMNTTKFKVIVGKHINPTKFKESEKSYRTVNVSIKNSDINDFGTNTENYISDFDLKCEWIYDITDMNNTSLI